MNLKTKEIRDNGVVGAGGGGFPAATKLSASAKVFIVNAAECEPLLHKDKELLVHFQDAFFAGLALAMEITGAAEGVIGIKEKHKELIGQLKKRSPANVRVHPLVDAYPAGDEFLLVFSITGQIIPPGGLPTHVGAVVNNVETLVNIGLGGPVTHKFLTVAGAVKKPATFRVPIGISVKECLDAAGGTEVSEFVVISGGVMMGKLVLDLHSPVTKTTGGLIVLPVSHELARRYMRPQKAMEQIGRSACDQCSFCTELCPRYLLGHPVEPHKVMRSLGFSPGQLYQIESARFCCECNLCSLYSCPESLDPKAMCASSKARLSKEKKNFLEKGPHPLSPYRKIPMKRLRRKLGLEGFRDLGELSDHTFRPKTVCLLLKQHAGVPARATSAAGETVRAGQCVAEIPDGALGAPVHTPVHGRIKTVDANCIVIETGDYK